jgi:hypothetical protein
MPPIAVTWAELLPSGPPVPTDRLSIERFADWLVLTQMVHDYDPGFLTRLGFPGGSLRHIEGLLDAIDVERGLPADTLEPTVRALQLAAALVDELRFPAQDLTMRLVSRRELEDPTYLDSEPVEPPPDRTGRVDVERVLTDL